MPKGNEQSKKLILDAQVDILLNKAKKWQPELKKLREIVLNCGLTEVVKWGKPCYTFQNGNVVLIFGFKAYCGLLFFKGSLINDPQGISIQPGKNSHVGRQIRFTNVGQIKEMEKVLKAYIDEAIKVQKAGLKVPLTRATKPISPELQKRFDVDLDLKHAFNSLTPGRKRGYLLFICSAKQSSTRERRIDACVPKILSGKGINE